MDERDGAAALGASGAWRRQATGATSNASTISAPTARYTPDIRSGQPPA